MWLSRAPAIEPVELKPVGALVGTLEGLAVDLAVCVAGAEVGVADASSVPDASPEGAGVA